MVGRCELKNIALARVKDSEILFSAQRYDGAIYLCGYSVETALKARICTTLGWSGYPTSRSEFQKYQSFRTHDLDVLLSLCGAEAEVKNKFLAEWSVVATWDPEIRYRSIGSVSKEEAELMIEASKTLVGAL